MHRIQCQYVFFLIIGLSKRECKSEENQYFLFLGEYIFLYFCWYMNEYVHLADKSWNLGKIKTYGCLPAKNIIEL